MLNPPPPHPPAPGPGASAITRLAPATYKVFGWFKFGQIAGDGQSVTLQANYTLAMDPAVTSYARPAPLDPSIILPTSGGGGFYGSEPPGSTTEWTNATHSSNFNLSPNFSGGAPASTSDVYLADIGV